MDRKHKPPFPPKPHFPPDGYYDMYEPPLGHRPPIKPHNHSARFTPHMLNYHIPHAFKFWCNKVVPLVYDDSLSYMELLNKVVLYLNNMLEDEKLVAVNMEEICRAFHDLEMFVNDYFSYYQSKGLVNNDIAVTNDNYLEILPDCDTAQMNTIYRLKFVEGSTQTIPANLPEGAKPFSGAECVLINLSNFILKHLGNEWCEIPPNGEQYSTKQNYQMLFTDKDVFFRENDGDKWLEWQSVFGNWWSDTWLTVKNYIDEGDENLRQIIEELRNSLGSLAFKDSASGTYTPRGTVSQPTFTGTEGNVTVSGVATGTVSQPLFVGNSSTISVTGEIEGDVSQPTFTGTQATINIGVTLDNDSVIVDTDETSIKSTLNEGTLPSLTYDSSNTAIVFNAGTSPTYETTNVVTNINSANVEEGMCTGAITYTPQGTVSKPEFDGESFSLSTTYTPTGTVTQPTFAGDRFNSTGTFTPSGTVSQPTFTGEEDTITVE